MKKNYVKEDDSDDELFAFFEKDDGDSSTKTTVVSDKKIDSKAKSKSQVSNKVLVSSASDMKTNKDSSKIKIFTQSFGSIGCVILEITYDKPTHKQTTRHAVILE